MTAAILAILSIVSAATFVASTIVNSDFYAAMALLAGAAVVMFIVADAARIEDDEDD